MTIHRNYLTHVVHGNLKDSVITTENFYPKVHDIDVLGHPYIWNDTVDVVGYANLKSTFVGQSFRLDTGFNF